MKVEWRGPVDATPEAAPEWDAVCGTKAERKAKAGEPSTAGQAVTWRRMAETEVAVVEQAGQCHGSRSFKRLMMMGGR